MNYSNIVVVETAVFAGWYKLFKDNEKLLAGGVLVVGILTLGVLYLIIRRTAQYLNALRKMATKELPTDLESPLWGIRSSVLGVVSPLICIVFNLVLFIWQLV